LREKGGLSQYTKKERLLIDRKIEEQEQNGVIAPNSDAAALPRPKRCWLSFFLINSCER